MSHKCDEKLDFCKAHQDSKIVIPHSHFSLTPEHKFSEIGLFVSELQAMECVAVILSAHGSTYDSNKSFRCKSKLTRPPDMK